MFIQSNYGIDWNGPIPEEADEETVEVPIIPSPISNEDKIYLDSVYTREIILASDSHAVDVYIAVREYVYCHQNLF